MQMTNPPLIVTLAMGKEATALFNQLRIAHFPPERNFIDAHLTLFHALPNEPAITNTIKEAATTQKPFELRITAPVSIGKGVAFKVESSELQSLHSRLQKHWKDVLTAQDKQKLWPHITIQNKVPPAEAKALLEQLLADFSPMQTIAAGLQLWEYLGGPWGFVGEYEFTAT
ncbi:2'-5' RNA ligase family protein [Segetibacter sp. 3557_3]|nr:2'-5' RNA ligase family protein [Segetibacter sp. 3557_3]